MVQREAADTAKGLGKDPGQELTLSDKTPDRLSEIIARDRAESELWLSIYQSAWEESYEAQIVFDQNGRVFRANRRACMMLRSGQRQLRNKPVAELIPERFREAHSVHTRAFVRDPVPRLMGGTRCLWLLTADGDEIPVEISLTPLDSDSGLFINIVMRRRESTP
jgi:PAS domain S-box-containing protein